MTRAILDTGPLVAFFNPRDQYRTWALDQSRQLAAPLVTCEAVLTEAYHLLGHVHGARAALRRWLRAGRVSVPFQFSRDSDQVLSLLDRYADLPMDFADACVVCLCERASLPVFTTDTRDFQIYRLPNRAPLPLILPA